MMPDHDALARTHAAAFRNDRGWSAVELAELLSQTSTVFVGDPDAFLIGRVIGDEAEILTLATAPALRRRGLAKAVLATFLEDAASRGVTSTVLEVASDNAPAKALYAAFGFQEAARRPGYYRRADGTTVDALLLRRLSPHRDPLQA